MKEIVEIYVRLLEEGTPTLMQTTAEKIGNDIFKLLPSEQYDPEDEIWEFLPNTYVRGEVRRNGEENLLIAMEQVGEPKA